MPMVNGDNLGIKGTPEEPGERPRHGNIGQAESWRRSLSRKRWRWIPSATMRCWKNLLCFQLLFLDIETRAAELHWSNMCFWWIWGCFFFNINPIWIQREFDHLQFGEFVQSRPWKAAQLKRREDELEDRLARQLFEILSNVRSHTKKCPNQKSEVLLCCYAVLLIKSLFLVLNLDFWWICCQVTEPREPGSSGPFEGVPVSVCRCFTWLKMF